MNRHFSLAFLAMLGAPVSVASPVWAQAVAESKLPQSSVSILVEPRLNDGRLVVKVAAKNLGGSPVSFGPSNVGVAKPGGETIAVYPLSSLIDDVRMAAGMLAAPVPTTAPTQGAYAAPQQNIRDGGQMDVTGFTGGSAVGVNEFVRRSRSSRKAKPTISKAEAEQQIGILKQAILQDSTIAPGQITAGQVVTEKLTFAKTEDRTLHLRVRVAGDEHGFTILAPSE